MDYLGEDIGESSYVAAPAYDPNTPNPHFLNSFNSHQPSQPNQANQPSQPTQPDQDDEYDGMPPPANSEFPSLQELLDSVQNHARVHGYATVTASNNYQRGMAYVRCDRGGKYVNHWKLTDATRVRKNRTRRLVGCEWKARAKRDSEGMWVLTMMHDKHNDHGPSTDAASHPSQRQLSAEAKEAARKAFNDDKKSPKQVLELLQAQFNPAVTAQDVYNLKAKINRDAAKFPEDTPAETITERTEPEIPTDPALQMPGKTL